MINLHIMPHLINFIPVQTVLEKIERAYNSDSFMYHLTKMRFDHRFTKPIDFDGYEILKILYWTNQDVFLSSYTQNFLKWRFVPVNAYKPAEKVDWIFFNSRQLKRRSKKEWEETLWHELVHIADHLSEKRFDHGENELEGKEETAPVKFAKFMANIEL